MKHFLPVVSWGYLVLVILLWLVMLCAGDSWWPATLLLFGPRWALLLPLVILLPLAALRKQGLLIPLLLGGLIVSGPFMGIQVPGRKSGSSTGTVLRVVTCNIHNGVYSGKKLAAYIREVGADVVALQECPADLGFSIPEGWQIVRVGGLAVVSRFPVQQAKTLHALQTNHKWPRASLLHCQLTLPDGVVQFASVHLPSPRFGLQAILDRRTILRPSKSGLLVSETANRRRTAWEVRSALATVAAPLVIAGDLNMPVDSTIYRKVWRNTYANAFSQAGSGYGWTVRGGPGKIEFGVRVDHILLSKGLDVLLCETGPDVGSDHLPLVADIAIAADGTQ